MGLSRDYIIQETRRLENEYAASHSILKDEKEVRRKERSEWEEKKKIIKTKWLDSRQPVLMKSALRAGKRIFLNGDMGSKVTSDFQSANSKF